MNPSVELYRGHAVKAGIEELAATWKISVDVSPGDDITEGEKVEFKLAEIFDRNDGALNALMHMVDKAKQKIDESLR